MEHGESITVQGRQIDLSVIDGIKAMMADNPAWGRKRLSLSLCERWEWRRPNGKPKDMSCRMLLLKLERRGLLELPAPRNDGRNHLRGLRVSEEPHIAAPVSASLASLQPLRLVEARSSQRSHRLFNCLLARHHYLGFKSTVGENMKYLLLANDGRPLGCLLFGSAAWKAKGRDEHIGWSVPERERNLNLLTGNTRFLILPWVRVAHLASFALGQALRRLNRDWLERHGHPIHLVETFVDRSRFLGTCYKAANWLKVGETTGRSRQDRHHRMKAPAKDIYVYPLSRNYREALRQ